MVRDASNGNRTRKQELGVENEWADAEQDRQPNLTHRETKLSGVKGTGEIPFSLMLS